ncbi:hypothetical protein F5Y13DRAFT_207179 [Hypoxylon sp. FL1857]|nr:hypothetical protein F5Y13DRAFT_207179 [Hypoxylon sp. FL1857]
MSYSQAVKDGCVISLSNLHFIIERDVIESIVKAQELPKPIFRWEKQGESSGRQHNGWVHLQFANRDITKNALGKLNGFKLAGRAMAAKIVSQASPSLEQPSMFGPTPGPSRPSGAARQSMTAPKPVPGPSSPLNRTQVLSNPSSPKHGPSAREARAPAPAKPSYHPALYGMGLEEYPEEWTYSTKQPKHHLESFFSRYQRLDDPYTEAGIKPRFVLTRDNEDKLKFHSRPYPTPDPADDQEMETTYIYMTKATEDDNFDVERVPIQKVSEHEKQGWDVWNPPKQPTDIDNNDREFRSVSRLIDVETTDKPQMDTEKIFRQYIGILKREDTKSDWTPGRPIGSQEGSISFSRTLQTPADCNGVTATSHGHVHKYKRLAEVGAGWGDYDKWYDWQSNGRRINPELVDDKDWLKFPTDLAKHMLINQEDPNDTVKFAAEKVKSIGVAFDPPKTLEEMASGGGVHGRSVYGGGRGGRRGGGFSNVTGMW